MGAAVSSYARPVTLTEALRLLAEGNWRVLAGGTDLYPGTGRALPGSVLDVTEISGFRGITTNNGLRIGAATPWAEIAGAAGLPPALRALQQASSLVGGRQIQVAGTIGGNLCNASPAADGVPPLLALGAEVELASAEGIRRLALTDFLLGPRKTALRAGEVMVAVVIPEAGLSGRSAFVKLGARTHLVISIAMVAARVVVEAGRVTEAAVAVGSCSAVATRLPAVEAALRGAVAGEATGRIAAGDVMAALSPIDDVRATPAYRGAAAVELVRRAVTEALS
ncbi:MAG: xanthine dehydrogenase [Rhodobacter sp.]|nr:xanthine dehydrogenase [Rhodobacter sp.]